MSDNPPAQPAPPETETATESRSDSPPEWARTLDGNIGSLNESIRGLIAMAQQNQQVRAQEAQAANAPRPVDPNEMETWSRAQFSDHIVSQVLAAVNKNVVDPLREQMNQITAGTTRQEVTGLVREAAAKYQDFEDWKPEMLRVAQATRGLTPDQLYHIAKGTNPEKAKEVSAKYAPKPPANGGRIRLSGFGGLTPGQSGTGNRGAGKMNGHEAAELAWAETVKALGGEPLFDSYEE